MHGEGIAAQRELLESFGTRAAGRGDVVARSAAVLDIRGTQSLLGPPAMLEQGLPLLEARQPFGTQPGQWRPGIAGDFRSGLRTCAQSSSHHTHRGSYQGARSHSPASRLVGGITAHGPREPSRHRAPVARWGRRWPSPGFRPRARHRDLGMIGGSLHPIHAERS